MPTDDAPHDPRLNEASLVYKVVNLQLECLEVDEEHGRVQLILQDEIERVGGIERGGTSERVEGSERVGGSDQVGAMEPERAENVDGEQAGPVSTNIVLIHI